ncbi:hypothetical protein BDV38DRAFT_283762 [Aspergillus pseudotamarii]|uniref:Uncharacterized protein n=1 Tax=Aspergillus pseudotamarii TaxID=132259 RepID=A0A5N6SRI7_ASPPS|nr:uncharacterized protein BDV38DRAFT_283762 [Aspergillus pseudotamarii]KAE8136547.1 hypothetical protein BDV38DRAFT_283762 [Aspergillus pseudotamarii]
MASVRSNGLRDVVRAAVPLQDLNYRRVTDDKIAHPDSTILVDLAVHEEGVRRILRQLLLMRICWRGILVIFVMDAISLALRPKSGLLKGWLELKITRRSFIQIA